MINRIVQVLTYVAVSLILVYMIAYFLQGFPKTLEQKRDFVRMIAATITSMVPQGLVLTATMAFTLGAIVMSLRGAIVQRLSAVETMASIDVICTDKTGTLTTNNLRLEEIVFLEPSLGEDAIRQKIRAFAWASIDHSNRNIQALRSALGQESRRAGSVSDRSAPVEPIDQIPFKSQNRYSAVRLRDNDGDQILVMGALEALHERIEFWRDTPKPAGESSSLRGALDSLNAQIAERQAQGQRLIVFGQITDDIVLANLTSLPMVPLQPLALLCFGDELRPEAPKVLQALAGQGIAFKVLSGDNPDTVRGTIGHLDLSLASGVAGAESSKPRHPAAHQGFEDSVPATLRVVSGQELSESADAESLIREHSIFGRVTPEQKVQIVEMLRKMGHRVAMIGDGVNDVLPIKKADLGIAMGEGSQASKTVSGLVLENNNFALLPETLEEGRVIVRNLRRLAKLFLVKNVYSLILILAYASGWFGIPFPYVPQQVTLLNWLVIGIPAFVIALSRERSTRASKPRFLLEVGWFALRTGIVFGLAGVVTLLIAGKLQSDEKYQHTMLLSVLILLGITALLRALRDGDGESLKADTRFRLLGAFAIPVYLAAMYWPLSAWFFELWPLEVVDWAMVLAVAGVAYLLSLISDLIPVPNAMSVISWHQSASDRAR
ncbi:MAG: HAD-IC family P-type ATPase [Planctomycetes bacterium]|nr:HAD-IC family P-type ATPase [Planctomycetota bacterium]